MRIAVFDDNKAELTSLQSIAEEWCRSIFPATATVHCFDTIRKLEKALASEPVYDLYFLDIMTDQAHDAGFRLAEKIRQKDVRTIIVFTTSSREYVFSAFEVSAYRYLVKPVSPETIRTILDSALQTYYSRKKNVGEFQVSGKKKVVPFADITHVESLALHHKARLFLVNGDRLDASLNGQPFSSFADMQLTKDFFQCHRGYIVNMLHITGYGKDYVNICHTNTIPIGRDRKNDFINSIHTFYKELL